MSTLLIQLASLITAFLISAMVVRGWIRVCKEWNLYETTNSRKVHTRQVASMGGIGIYAGLMLSFSVFSDRLGINTFPMLIPGGVLLFFTGFFDDLLDMRAAKKFMLQLVAAAIIAAGGTRLHSLHGLFGIEQLPIWAQYVCTVFFICSVSNAWNLIDGIDGLAASLGIISSLSLGVLFMLEGRIDASILCLALSGALGGFLIYNFHPAKVFMGDTGSLMIGFILSSASIHFLQEGGPLIGGMSKPLVVIALLFIPVYDVIRVTLIRLLTGKNPFGADRNHIHHMIMKSGFSQRATTILISSFSLMFIFSSWCFSGLSVNYYVILVFCLAMITMNLKVIGSYERFYALLQQRRMVQS